MFAFSITDSQKSEISFFIKLKSNLITQFIPSDICHLILNPLSQWNHKRKTCSHIFLKRYFRSSSPLTCCKVWRRLPWQHPSRWCGWRPSRPEGCWSRSGSLLGWSSWGGTWERRSTASPGRGASRRGRSYTPWPPEETPPDRDAQLKPSLRTERHPNVWFNNHNIQPKITSFFRTRCQNEVKCYPQCNFSSTFPFKYTEMRKSLFLWNVLAKRSF